MNPSVVSLNVWVSVEPFVFLYFSGEQKKREEFYEERGEVDPSMFSVASSPRLLQAFQCWTLKNEKAWYLIARASQVPVQSMGRVENRVTYRRFLKSPSTGEC